MLRLRTKIAGVVLLGAITGAAIWWMTRDVPPISIQIEASDTRSRTLLALAGRQAAKIPAVDIRLTRLLNLADQEIQRGYKAEARDTLSFASEALAGKDAATLDEQARISGWVSVSELSRQANDKAAASAACDGAVVALRAIEDPARRCDYVIGVCNELQYLKGKGYAAKLLDEAGEWTRSIDSIGRRRQAVTGFASALFNLDDYAAGERMISREEDAVWGADMLTQLASMAQPANDGRPLPSAHLRKDAAPQAAPAASAEISLSAHADVRQRGQLQVHLPEPDPPPDRVCEAITRTDSPPQGTLPLVSRRLHSNRPGIRSGEENASCLTCASSRGLRSSWSVCMSPAASLAADYLWWEGEDALQPAAGWGVRESVGFSGGKMLGFGANATAIPNDGSIATWDITVPSDGDYEFWRGWVIVPGEITNGALTTVSGNAPAPRPGSSSSSRSPLLAASPRCAGHRRARCTWRSASTASRCA